MVRSKLYFIIYRCILQYNFEKLSFHDFFNAKFKNIPLKLTENNKAKLTISQTAFIFLRSVDITEYRLINVVHYRSGLFCKDDLIN